MTTALSSDVRVHSVSSPELTLVERKLKPVKAWAVVGALFLALEAFVLVRWIFSGQAVRNTTGYDQIPGWMQSMIVAQQIVYPIMAMLAIYFLVIRPWRRQGHLTLDGLFTLVFATLYWQDPLTNYLAPWFTYNTGFINFGSWTSSLPGWVSPNGHLLSEPVIAAGSLYPGFVFPFIILSNWVMRKAKQRYPRMGKFGLAMVCLSFMAFGDLIFEMSWSRMGFYTFNGVIDDLTIWQGHYYQFPLYETLTWGGVWACWACLRYFRDDKGRTIAERGIDDVKATPKQKTGLRFLALVGICNLIWQVYNIPTVLLTAHIDSWNADIQSRPYLTSGICGPDTAYACPGPGTPIPRPNSRHVDPTGQLITPPGSEDLDGRPPR